MDLIKPPNRNTPNSRRQQASRVRRKVYLDTYAKQRGGVSANLPLADLNEYVHPATVAATMPASPDTPMHTVAYQQVDAAQSQPPVLPRANNPAALHVVSQGATVQAQPGFTPSFSYGTPPPATAAAVAPVQAQTASSIPASPAVQNVYTPVPLAQAAAASPINTPPVQPQQLAVAQQSTPVHEEKDSIAANLRALYEDRSLTDIITRSKSKSASHVRTIAASALACGVLSVGIFTFFAQVDSSPIVAQPVGSPVIEVEVPVEQPRQRRSSNASGANASARVAADPSQPTRLVASAAGVNAPIIGLGVTPDGLIDVPEAYGTVGWYNKGVKPGEDGPAILVGHYAGGLGAVFDNLHKLNKGDLITVTNGQGKSFTYKMVKKAEYHKDKVPMEKLFQNGEKPRLEIITCQGGWTGQTYDKRLVVTAELVD